MLPKILEEDPNTVSTSYRFRMSSKRGDIGIFACERNFYAALGI